MDTGGSFEGSKTEDRSEASAGEDYVFMRRDQSDNRRRTGAQV